jgi:hypothetical protein
MGAERGHERVRGGSAPTGLAHGATGWRERERERACVDAGGRWLGRARPDGLKWPFLFLWNF